MDPSQFWNGAGAYQINQSLRFDGSAYLNRTPGSAGNRKTFTYSFWIKRAKLGAYQRVLGLYTGASFDGSLRVCNDTDSIGFESYVGSLQASIVTSSKYRDPSAWMHVVYSVDTTQATASDRVKIYVNGQQVTSFSVATYPSQNADLAFNNNSAHYIGQSGYPSEYLDAYLAEFNFIDGTALTPSSFGETNTITGAWIPKKYSGSYGTNGFYLKFESSGIGTDSSGNGNNFTASGFSTSGTGTDVMSDTPTTNWCTLTPLGNGSSSAATSGLSNGNLQVSGAITGGFTGSIGIPTGKWYWEVSLETVNTLFVGVCNDNRNVAADPGVNIDNEYGFYFNPTINYINNGGNPWSTGSVTANDVIGVAIDATSLTSIKIWLSKNNTWYNSTGGTTGDPAAGTNQIQTITDGKTLYPYCAIRAQGSSTMHANFGQRSFSYTPPTGFKGLNTANLPEPTIQKGSKYFNSLLYTGTGGTKAVSGAGFQPDLVWIKNRSRASSSHVLVDAVRGATKALSSNLTNAEVTTNGTDDFRSFDSDGFTVGDSSNYFVNSTGDTHVAWAWDANGAGSSNTAGSITSTVSANATAGFSIATYTGNGTAGATVGHGLGVVPKMVIVKRRDSTGDWPVWHQQVAATGSDRVLFLNTTDAQTSAGTNFNSQSGTSSVFYVGTNPATNASGGTYVAYCFSEVAGYSKFGSYTGNGSSDGPFVFCGFRPRWVMMKSSSLSGSNWRIFDTARDPANVMIYKLSPNNSDAEYTDANTKIDFTSNGFKLRETAGDMNSSGATYVFAAFAELPFRYANAR